MIVFELKCSSDHRFEAWFRDGAAYDAQVRDGTLACPLCGDHAVTKAPMAPRIAKGRDTAPDDRAKQAQAEVLTKLREIRKAVEENCDYVGDRFAEEARRIHYGETDPRGIYGETTPKEAEELKEEGVTFQRIPWLPGSGS